MCVRLIIEEKYEGHPAYPSSGLTDLLRVFLKHERLIILISHIPRSGQVRQCGDDFYKFFGVSHFTVLTRSERTIRLKATMRGEVVRSTYGTSKIQCILNFSLPAYENVAQLEASHLLYVHVFPDSRRLGDTTHPVNSLEYMAALADLVFQCGGNVDLLNRFTKKFEQKSEAEKLGLISDAKSSDAPLESIQLALQ